jgi:Tol biopolymer transport system component/DNA-binding winged helix-turn-helix (wHTH) protein
MAASNTSAQVPWRIARFGTFEVNASAGELRKSGLRLRVQDQPFQILVMLLKSPGEIVTRETLRDSLWPADTFVEFDHSLNTAVKKLRQALGDEADNPRFIETIPRKGYKFVAPVQFHAERSEAALDNLAPLVSDSQAKVGGQYRREVFWLASGGGLVLVLLAVIAYILPWKDSEPEKLTLKPLTWYTGEEVTPAFSPDGTRVAFAWNNNVQDAVHIYVKVVGTDEPVAITSGKSFNLFPAWSPDGRYIAFRRVCEPKVRHHMLMQVTPCTAGTTGLYMVPSIGGRERLLRATAPSNVNGQLSFSPDGKQLAFADIENNRWAIFSMSQEDFSVRRITNPLTISGDTEPAFSPDGKWLAFSRDTKDSANVHVMSAAGGEIRQLTQSNVNPVIAGLAWTSDSKGVIYGGMGISKVRFSDGKHELLTPVIFAFYPTVHGQQLVYGESVWDQNIYRIDVDGTQVKKVEPLIASSRIDESGQVSPDGKSIAFQSTRTGTYEIFRANADGTNQVQLTHFNGTLTGTPNWSSDSKWIVFDSRPKGNADILTVSAEGGAVKYLTTEATNETVPSISRDGRWLYFASDRSGAWNVWKKPMSSDAATQVTFNGGFAPRESVDGKWVFYSKGVEQGGIWRVPAAGGTEELVLHNPDGFWGFWIPSEKGIYYITQDKVGPFSLNFYDFATRKMTHMMKLPKATSAGAPGMGISPDGKSLLLVLVESHTSDLVLADGLR